MYAPSRCADGAAGYSTCMSDYILDLGNGNGKAIIKQRSTRGESVRGEVDRASEEPREVEGYPMTAKLRPDTESPNGANAKR